MKKWKEEGKIRHIVFSFHDSVDVLDRILTEHPEAEAVQIALNYIDWDAYFVHAKDCYEVIRKHGRQVIIMKPVKGGMLVKVSAETADSFSLRCTVVILQCGHGKCTPSFSQIGQKKKQNTFLDFLLGCAAGEW